MALPATKTYTIAEFEAFIARPENRDRSFELIHGLIVEKAMPTDEHATIVNLGLFFLTGHALEHNLGLPGPERRFVFPDDTQDSRQPDISMILDPTIPLVTEGAMTVIPDVIIEVKSPDDTYEDMRDKAKFYIARGVRLVLLLFPRPRTVEVYRPGLPSEILTLEQTIEGYDVLPGFRLPVAKLFITKRSG
jgi:Uma2 family endonuclease